MSRRQKIQRGICALVLGLASTSALSGDSLTLALVSESLSGGHTDWSSTDTRYTHTFADRRSAYLGSVQDSRFGEEERTTYLGGSFPLRRGLTVTGELGGGSNGVLPERYLTAGFARELGDGVVAKADVKASWYQNASTQTGIVGFEKYAGPYRFALDAIVTHLSGTSGLTASYRGAIDYDWSARVTGGLFVASGREAEAGPAGVTARLSQAAGARLRWQLTDNLKCTVHVARTWLSDAYSRTAVGASLDLSF